MAHRPKDRTDNTNGSKMHKELERGKQMAIWNTETLDPGTSVITKS